VRDDDAGKPLVLVVEDLAEERLAPSPDVP
jgi:hypothetical protein